MPGAPEQEPSIEEILASIRQIISDDDDHSGTAAEAAPPQADPEPVAPKPPVAPPPSPPTSPAPVEDEVLDLTDPLPDEDEKPMIDMEEGDDEPFKIDMVDDEPAPVFTAPEPSPAPPPPPPAPKKPAAPAPAGRRADDDVSILTDAAKNAALSGFSRLAGNTPLERGTTPHVSPNGATIEDIIRDMMTPMLRGWLDENLPEIIEKLVQKELDKLARKARDD